MGVDREDFSDASNWQTPQELPDLRRVGIVALDIPGGSEFEHNPVRAQNGAGGHDVIPEVCAECHLNPPDGSEQLRRLSAIENLWLHKRCEDTFIRRRMEEEGISWSTMPRSTAPAPSVGKTIDANGGSPPPPPPPPTRQGGAVQAKAPSPLTPAGRVGTNATSIEFAVLTKTGGPLTKRISLDPSDKITSDGNACYMSRGRAKRVRIDGLHELAALIEGLTSQQAITLGALHDDLPDEVRIVTKAALAAGVAANDVVARTAKNFVYRPGRSALALFDYDMKGMPPGVTQQLTTAGGFWAALTSVLPALASTGHLLRLSTSAGLNRTDTRATFPGSGGLHGYVVLADGADAVRFLKALHVRCWLSGYGWMNVGAAGQLLERSIIDRMVGASERLMFEGPPVVEPPLRQDAAARRPRVVAGDILDTARACSPLSILEQQAFDRLRAQERLRLAPECARKRAAWIAARKARLVASGMTAEAATSMLEKWANGVLLASVELPFDDPDLAGTTVGDVLDDPARFVGETLADPIEGIEDGRGKAMVMWGGGVTFIHSFAHGHATYKLRYDAGAVQARIAQAADAVAALVKLAGMADLSAVEVTKLVHDAAHRANVGVNAVKSMLRAAAAEQREQRAAAAHQRMLAGRTDPRPMQDRPALDAEWLPVLGVLDAVASAVERVRRPRRDIDGTLARERRMPIAQTHAFTTANDEGDDA